MHGIRTWDRRMVGTDESTELLLCMNEGQVGDGPIYLKNEKGQNEPKTEGGN